MSSEMVVKPQQKCHTVDDSTQSDLALLTGQPEASSESDVEEEEEQGGYQLLPQSEDEGGRDQECEEQVEITGTLAFPSQPPQGQPLAAVPTPADGQEPSTALLDEGQVGVIKQAMVGFSLPPAAAPQWAKEVPEEVWKERLLTQLRAARAGDNTQCFCDNELTDTQQ